MTKAFANILFEHETIYFNQEKGENTVKQDESLGNNDKPLDTQAVSEPLPKEPELPKTIVKNSIFKNSAEPNTHKIAELIVIVKDFTSEKREFLAAILKALNKDINDIPVYDLNNLENINIREIIANTKALFSFGVTFTDLGFKSNLTHYILKMAQEKHYLMADDLSIVQTNANNEKRMLWEALKGIF